MSNREDRLWSALTKKYRDLVAELDQLAEQEADAIADAYAKGAPDTAVRAIERDTKAKSRKLRDALARLEREALKLPCGCVCDRCYRDRRHCRSEPCRHGQVLTTKQSTFDVDEFFRKVGLN